MILSLSKSVKSSQASFVCEKIVEDSVQVRITFTPFDNNMCPALFTSSPYEDSVVMYGIKKVVVTYHANGIFDVRYYCHKKDSHNAEYEHFLDYRSEKVWSKHFIKMFHAVVKRDVQHIGLLGGIISPSEVGHRNKWNEASVYRYHIDVSCEALLNCYGFRPERYSLTKVSTPLQILAHFVSVPNDYVTKTCVTQIRYEDGTVVRVGRNTKSQVLKNYRDNGGFFKIIFSCLELLNNCSLTEVYEFQKERETRQ